MYGSCLLAFCLFLCIQAQNPPTVVPAPPPGPVPVPPKSWPSQFWSWVITSIVKVNVSKPIYLRGQFVVYDSVNQYSCRYAEEELINTSKARGNDYCDYVKKEHYYVNNTEVREPECTAESTLDAMPLLSWPTEFLEKAVFLGTTPVNQKFCHHFHAYGVQVAGQDIQLDVWFTNDTLQWPCQISAFEIGSPYLLTWAFDAFSEDIPPKSRKCTQARLFCAEKGYTCDAKAAAETDKLGMGLRQACDPRALDCDSLNPGGVNFLPNDLLHHCNWAFNASFQKFKNEQGEAACDFGGVAEMVPPKTHGHNRVLSSQKRSSGSDFPFNPLNWLPNDVVCPR